MINFYSFSGYVTAINEFAFMGSESAGCYKLMSVSDSSGNIVNFVIAPDTYFTDQEIVRVSDFITGYYDGNAPAVLIYPPQYPALIVVKYSPSQNIKVAYFNNQLISSDG